MEVIREDMKTRGVEGDKIGVRERQKQLTPPAWDKGEDKENQFIESKALLR